jgi:hypothetical protein
VVQIPGRRKREFCNTTCRQRHHRKHESLHARVDVAQATSGALQEQLAALQEENTTLRTTMQTLFDFHEKLRDVKEMARTDTQACRRQIWDCDQSALASDGARATRAQLPLTSAITLEERKRGLDGAAHQYTVHPRGSRPQGCMAEVKGHVVAV